MDFQKTAIHNAGLNSRINLTIHCKAIYCLVTLSVMFLMLGSNVYSDESTLLELSPLEMTAGTKELTLSVNIRDDDLNYEPMDVDQDTTFDIATTGDHATTKGSVVIPDGESEGKFNYRNLEAGPFEITFTWSAGDSRLDGKTQSFDITVTPAQADSFIIDPEPGRTKPDRNIAPPPKVQLRDKYDNPVPQKTIEVRLITGNFTPRSITQVITNENGEATFNRLAIEEVGTYNLEFTHNNISKTSQDFDVYVDYELKVRTLPEDVSVTIIIDGEYKDSPVTIDDPESHIKLTAPSVHTGTPGDYLFREWRKDDESFGDGSNTVSFNINDDVTMTAVYEPEWPFHLRVKSSYPGPLEVASITGHGGTTEYELSGYKDGIIPDKQVHLVAPRGEDLEIPGYTFKQWEIDGTPQPKGDRILTFDLKDEHHTVKAVYDVEGGMLTVRLAPDVARKYAIWEIEQRIDDKDAPFTPSRNNRSHSTIALEAGEYELAFDWGNIPRELEIDADREFPPPGNKIITVDPDETTEVSASFRHPDGGPGSSDCFIATAAYGSGSVHKVNILRNWRDRVLLNSPTGVSAVNAYYQLSPPLAELIREKPAAKTLTLRALNPAVEFIDHFMGNHFTNPTNNATQ